MSASFDVSRTDGPLSYTATLFASRINDPLHVERSPSYVLSTLPDPTTNVGLELLGTLRKEPFSVTATYTYVRARETVDAIEQDVPLTPRHSAGIVGMWEAEDVGRVGIEWYYTGRQSLEENPYRAVSEPYMILGLLAEKQFGRVRLFVNGENLTGVQADALGSAASPDARRRRSLDRRCLGAARRPQHQRRPSRPILSRQRDGSARRTERGASGEVSMTTMFTENVSRRSYTVTSSSAGRAIEVVTMPDVRSVVFVVDDDISVRESLELLIRTAGWQPETFASGQEFLSRPRATVPCCLVLDVTLPGLNGLELQHQLAERTEMPIIFITGHGDVPMSVQAMKAGAVEFLTKPFKDDVLLEAIHGAVERSRVALRLDSEVRAVRTCYESLTPREREVMALVVSGLLNKQVGGELGISEITVKAHRGQVMRKMKADSLPDLVTMAARLGLRSASKV